MTRQLIFFFSLLMVSCQSNSNAPTKDASLQEATAPVVSDTVPVDIDWKDSIIYHSDPNGVAEIQLSLGHSGAFRFVMDIFPEPMTEEAGSTIISKGKWTAKNNYFALVFEENPPSLDVTFDTSRVNSGFQILDSITLLLDVNTTQLNIWGITCTRQLPEDTIRSPLALTSAVQRYITPENDTVDYQYIDQNCAVLIFPTDEQIDHAKAQLGEEDFYIVADDNAFYMSNFIELMDQLNITTITCEKRQLKFFIQPQSLCMDLDQENIPEESYWNALLFQKDKAPIFVDLVAPDVDAIQLYFQ